ncbi:type VI secretion system protein TssL, short form [Erwinia sp. BNK-24-b]|uniref:type VI secretion system protein TssL, short form n=1 Tax=unclassified Erwinia TaxID=2622719 RepID=UPI0039BF47DC
MKENALSLVDRVFSSGWLLVCQLRNGQDIIDGEALYQRACGWLDNWQQQLSEAGISKAHSQQMLYAVCALLDESVMNRGKQDNGYQYWITNPLQVKYFNAMHAGEKLWERIRMLLAEPAPDPHMLTCYYRVLQLGFSGLYRASRDKRREDIMQRLAQQVAPYLLQDIPLVSRPKRLYAGRQSGWLFWGGGIALLMGLWLLLSFSLEHIFLAGRLG